MPPIPTVCLIKNGAVVTVENPSPEVKRILEATLYYQRKVREQRVVPGRQYGTTQFRSIPIECYKYVHDPDKLFPPRIMAHAGFIPKIAAALKRAGIRVTIRDVHPHPHPEIFEPQWDRLKNVKWRYGQRTCLQRLFANEFGTVQFPTGWGKSFLARAICQLLPKAKIAITTASLDVLKDLYDNISLHLPNVGIVCSKKRSNPVARVVCYSAGMLNHCEKAVDILIADEHHELCTDPNFKRFSAKQFLYARHWGMSANFNDRSDKADFEMIGFFGPLIAKVSYAKAVEHKCIVPIEVQWRDVVLDKDPGDWCTQDVARERHSIWRNKERNKLIAEDAKSFGDDEQVLITVKTLDHGFRLRKLLPEYTFVYSENAFTSEAGEGRFEELMVDGLVGPGEPPMTWQRREQLKKDFESGKLKKAIATGVWKRGVDFKQLAILIRADATSSAIADTQIPGRTSRINDTVQPGSKTEMLR